MKLKAIELKAIVIGAIACLFWISLFWIIEGAIAPPVLALTPVDLSNLSYRDCPAELAEGMTVSGSIQKANCFLITGTAHNSSDKYVVDADVFGRIYDAYGNSVMQNRTRVGTIPVVPPGDSEFEIRISVAESQKTPLKLEQFKASGFSSRVRPYYYDDFQL